jgi:hypothetical protein
VPGQVNELAAAATTQRLEQEQENAGRFLDRKEPLHITVRLTEPTGNVILRLLVPGLDEDGVGGDGIERGGRLVEQQDLGIDREHDAQPLLLPAGELVVDDNGYDGDFRAW